MSTTGLTFRPEMIHVDHQPPLWRPVLLNGIAGDGGWFQPLGEGRDKRMRVRVLALLTR
jgi:hypothetical protein